MKALKSSDGALVGTRHSAAPPSAPLVSAEVDVSTLPWMPARFSFFEQHPLALLADAEPYRAMVILIARAWKQRPAMSLPSDERALAALAGFGRDVAGWQAVQDEVLRDWVLCTDKRWHHPALAPWVLQAWASKLRFDAFSQQQSERAKKGAAKRSGAAHVIDSAAMARSIATGEPRLRGGSPAAQPEREINTKTKIDNQKRVKNEEEGEVTLTSPSQCFSLGSVDVGMTVAEEDSGQGSDGVGSVDRVFLYWQQQTYRPNEILTADRRQIISARIADGITEESLCRAIDGAAQDDFYQGRTSKQRLRIDTLDVIFKHADRVLRLASLSQPEAQEAEGQLSLAARATARTYLELLESESDRCDDTQVIRIDAGTNAEEQK